jgi:hypothetical protein
VRNSKDCRETSMSYSESSAILRAILIGLTVECQRGGNPESCLLFEKRKLSYSDKVKWTRSLPREEVLNVYSAHLDCLHTNVSKLAGF